MRAKTSHVFYLAQVIILAAIYFGAAKLGLALSFYEGTVTLVWPPTGIALAAILLFGYRLWPGLVLGAFLANASTNAPLGFAVGTAFGNPLAAVVGAYLLRRLVGFHNSLERVRDVLGLVFLGAAVGTLVSATIGVANLCLNGIATWAAYGSVWWRWWLGDAMGVLIVAPPLLTWGTRPRVSGSPWRIVEAGALLISLVIVGLGVYGGGVTRAATVPLSYAIFPLAIWAALRFEPRGVATVTLIWMGLAVWGTARGFGPFVQVSVQMGLVDLSFTTVVAVATLLLAAVIAERKQAEAEREQLLAELERRTIQLQTTAGISKSASTILDPETLMCQAANLIREHFDLYYVGIFLVDEAGEYAVLCAGTGEAGRQMIQAEHKLSVGGKSMIGQSIARAQARIARDVGVEAIRFDNPYLPETRSELALPLISRGQCLGALTVQSTSEAAFSEQDIAVLQMMADRLAIAIENARLYKAAQQEIAERKRAEEAEREQRALAESLRDTAAALSGTLEFDTVLDRILANVGRVVPHDAATITLIDERGEARIARARGYAEQALEKILSLRLPVASTSNLRRMAETAQPVIMPDTHADPAWIKMEELMWVHSYAGMPIRLKGQVVGFLNLESATPGFFTPAHTDRLRAFADQAAIAIENARLYNEARRHAEELEQQAMELQARNEELDAFAHTVAHDLKNPVGLIIGFAEILAQGYAAMSDDDRQRSVQTMVRNGRKMNDIIDNLLLLAQVRKAQVEEEPLDMERIVAEALQRLVDMVKQYQADIRLPPDWTAALGYAPWVEEVWANYISNAIKYGGCPPHIELGATAQDDGLVRFWVRDNGAGLTSEDQARLFTPFTRLDQVRVKGHGLGLSIVKRIVEKLGGQVGVESQVGQGSVFSFTLPGRPVSS